MSAETDHLLKLRVKLDELEVQVRERIKQPEKPAMPAQLGAPEAAGSQDGQSRTVTEEGRALRWMEQARPWNSGQETDVQAPARTTASDQKEQPESFLSRIARFFGGGR